MKISPDQKRALKAAGIVAAILFAIWLLRRGTVTIPAVTGDGPGVGFNNVPPGYTSFNITPTNIPQFQPPPVNPGMVIQGKCCDHVNDGCFTAPSIDTGRGPLSMAQQLDVNAARNPEFATRYEAQIRQYYPDPSLAAGARGIDYYNSLR